MVRVEVSVVVSFLSVGLLVFVESPQCVFFVDGGWGCVWCGA